MSKGKAIDIDQVRSLAAEGLGIASIARAIGRSRDAIYRIAKRNRIEVNGFVPRERLYQKKPKSEIVVAAPPRASMYALAQFDSVVARALAVREGRL